MQSLKGLSEFFFHENGIKMNKIQFKFKEFYEIEDDLT
jgi:hypothetical protein